MRVIAGEEAGDSDRRGSAGGDGESGDAGGGEQEREHAVHPGDTNAEARDALGQRP